MLKDYRVTVRREVIESLVVLCNATDQIAAEEHALQYARTCQTAGWEPEETPAPQPYVAATEPDDGE